MKKRIAVIGGGIFGVTTAIKIANKNSVDLYETQPDILRSASMVNQYRVHKGYHYPRSEETVASLIRNEKSFKKEYGESIVNHINHFYCISKKDTLTNRKEYLNFCNQHKLKKREVSLNLVNQDLIDLLLQIKENIFDVKILRKICWKKLKENNVNVFLRQKANKNVFKNYDYVVICTYGSNNLLLNKEDKVNYQYELCEKPVVYLPEEFSRKSIVILDGPFMCVDPLGYSKRFLLGNVKHAIHSTNIGKRPILKSKYAHLLNNGIIKDPPITNFGLFIESGSRFIPKLKKAKHVGSMFTFRTVLPNRESTDERPTIVKKHNHKVISVFSGKIPSCINAAHEVDKIINS